MAILKDTTVQGDLVVTGKIIGAGGITIKDGVIGSDLSLKEGDTYYNLYAHGLVLKDSGEESAYLDYNGDVLHKRSGSLYKMLDESNYNSIINANYYTKSEVNSISSLENYYTSTSVDSKLSTINSNISSLTSRVSSLETRASNIESSVSKCLKTNVSSSQTVQGPVTFSSDITANSFNATSARILKENIESYADKALDLINSIDVVKFNFKNDPNKELKVGFIADDTDDLLSGKLHDKMDIYNCIGVLIKAVQELSAENKELKALVEGK